MVQGCSTASEDRPLPSMFGTMMNHSAEVERAPGPDQPFVIGVPARIPGGIDDHVRLVGVERAVGLVGQSGVAQRVRRSAA